MSEEPVFPGCRECLTEAITRVLPETMHVLPNGDSVPALIAKTYADLYAQSLDAQVSLAIGNDGVRPGALAYVKH